LINEKRMVGLNTLLNGNITAISITHGKHEKT